jgi:phosphoenolpyruvate-protein kinase (PTS system EI component)
VTKDGKKIVLCNNGNVSDVAQHFRMMAGGIGLNRSEFYILGNIPSDRVGTVSDYRSVLENMQEKVIIVRGYRADKQVDYLASIGRKPCDGLQSNSYCLNQRTFQNKGSMHIPAANGTVANMYL